MARHSSENHRDARHLSRAHALEEYSRRRRAHRRRVIVGVIATILLTTTVGIALAAVSFINRVNDKMSITGSEGDKLRAHLTEAQYGEPFYILLLGVDKDQGRTQDAEYGESDSNYRSDSIILARIDPTNTKVTLVSIHRDTLVDLDGDGGNDKINAAFSKGGPSKSVQVISDFAGVNISHYAQIDMDGMAAVVDAVGGIDVDLPIPVKDPNYTKLDLPAGKQHLDGATAALLCRARHAYDDLGDGDVYRAKNQRIVIQAVAEKVLANPTALPSTVEAMAGMVKTDMSVQDIVGLAQQMSNLDAENGIMSGMCPTEGVQIDGIWYEQPLKDEWKAMMQRVDAGEAPQEPGTESAADEYGAQLTEQEKTTQSDSSSSKSK